jgi:hypothetical protein
VIITQIIRMIFGYNPHNEDKGITSLARLSVWTGLHLGFGIICACMPVFRTYLPRKDGPINSGLRRLFGTVSGWLGRHSSISGSRSSRPQLPSFVHRYPEKTATKKSSADELPLTKISVLSEVEVLGAAEYHRA